MANIRADYRKYIYLSIVAVTVTLILAEVVCYVFYLLLEREWSAVTTQKTHYYEKSPIYELGYALKPNTNITRDGKNLRIDNKGLRVTVESNLEAQNIVALLGDSVVFGIGFSEEDTIPSLLQDIFNSRAEAVNVENLGVPGYSSRESLKFLELKTPEVNPNHIVYVLNANDFSRKDSVYEGGDNGLFRMYNPPVSKALWVVRKVIYRLKKGRTLRGNASHNSAQIIDWYKWLFAGNKDAVFKEIRAMKRLCFARDIKFSVLPLPPGSALGNNRFALSHEYKQLHDFLEKSNIPDIDIVDQLSAGLFDDTDHLNISGNRVIADAIWRHLHKLEE